MRVSGTTSALRKRLYGRILISRYRGEVKRETRVEFTVHGSRFAVRRWRLGLAVLAVEAFRR
jgi:hypothetical protein